MARLKHFSGAVAPKERINISYRPAVGNAKEDVELPFKILVLSDLSQRANTADVEDRKVHKITNKNLSQVIESFDLSLSYEVVNKIDGVGSIPVHLSVKSLADFEPDNIVSQVAPLKELLRLREALKALKGPIGNSPEIRQKLLTAATSSTPKKTKQ